MTYYYQLNENLSDRQASTVTIATGLREETYDRKSLEIAIANVLQGPFSTEEARLYRLAMYRGALAFLLCNLKRISDDMTDVRGMVF